MAYAKECVQPVYEYFEERFMRELSGVVSAFKAARLFCPLKAHEMQPLPSDIYILRAFPFLCHNSVLSDLKTELPTYLSKAADVVHGIDPVEWWSRAGSELSHWSTEAHQIPVVQPSSAQQSVFFRYLLVPLTISKIRHWRTTSKLL